jgi:predicted phage-related endonuclease
MTPSLIIHRCDQRTDAWFAARCGKVTGSHAADMLATIKSGEATGRRTLRESLVVERLAGQKVENGFVSADMQRGTDLEPAAIAAYEAQTGVLVQAVGFVERMDLAVGCSPDGVLGAWDGLLEVKCPRATTHLGYWRSGGVPSAYVAQLRHALYVTGLPYIDFASFDPRFPPELQLFVVRFTAADADLPAYDRLVRAFLAEVDTELQAVRTMINLRGTLREAAHV